MAKIMDAEFKGHQLTIHRVSKFLLVALQVLYQSRHSVKALNIKPHFFVAEFHGATLPNQEYIVFKLKPKGPL